MQREIFEEIKQELCDIKDFEYKTSLTILTMLELLVDKKLISQKEIKAKAKKLDKMAMR
jgi:hypothetical protein